MYNTICPICCYNCRPYKTIKLVCGHQIHSTCYMDYIRNTNFPYFLDCPFCKQAMHANDISIYQKTFTARSFYEYVMGQKLNRCTAICKHSFLAKQPCRNFCYPLNNHMCKMHHSSPYTEEQIFTSLSFILYFSRYLGFEEKNKLFKLVMKLLIENTGLTIQLLFNMFLCAFNEIEESLEDTNCSEIHIDQLSTALGVTESY